MDHNRKSYLKLGKKLDSLSRVIFTSRITAFVNYLDETKIKPHNFGETLEVKN